MKEVLEFWPRLLYKELSLKFGICQRLISEQDAAILCATERNPFVKIPRTVTMASIWPDDGALI
jgi:hypothetical protein